MPTPADARVRHRPLLVTDDSELLDEVLNLASSCGADVEVAPDPAAARDGWGSAPLVLVGVDLAEACGRARLPRRPGVVVVGVRPAADYEPPWALAELLNAEHIALLPTGASWLVDRLSMATGPQSNGFVVAVLGGRGGAGASVLSAGLAVSAVRIGRRALLVDGDPFGGGLDLMLGWEEVAGLRWPGLSHTSGRVSAPALVDALPSRGELAVLSCSREDGPALPVEAMVAAIDAGRRGWDLVVLDLPRRFDDAALAALASADHTLLIVPAEVRASAAAARVAAEALRHTESMSLVVRTPSPARLAPREIARAIGLPLAGSVRTEAAISRGLERGEPPAAHDSGPLAQLCGRLLAGFGLREQKAAA
jgi:secretion/DNA translocation related CpaE-like protein